MRLFTAVGDVPRKRLARHSQASGMLGGHARQGSADAHFFLSLFHAGPPALRALSLTAANSSRPQRLATDASSALRPQQRPRAALRHHRPRAASPQACPTSTGEGCRSRSSSPPLPHRRSDFGKLAPQDAPAGGWLAAKPKGLWPYRGPPLAARAAMTKKTAGRPAKRGSGRSALIHCLPNPHFCARVGRSACRI